MLLVDHHSQRQPTPDLLPMTTFTNAGCVGSHPMAPSNIPEACLKLQHNWEIKLIGDVRGSLN
jgi:hypothetical protein